MILKISSDLVILWDCVSVCDISLPRFPGLQCHFIYPFASQSAPMPIQTSQLPNLWNAFMTWASRLFLLQIPIWCVHLRTNCIAHLPEWKGRGVFVYVGEDVPKIDLSQKEVKSHVLLCTAYRRWKSSFLILVLSHPLKANSPFKWNCEKANFSTKLE